MERAIFSRTANMKKCAFLEARRIYVEWVSSDNQIHRHIYDLRNAIRGIDYNVDLGKSIEFALVHVNFINLPSLYGNSWINFYSNTVRSGDQTQFNMPTEFPYWVYTAPSETETVGTADKTIVFPPPETTEEWGERISARLLHLTRRGRVLPHEEVHQNARSRRICNEVHDSHDEVHRYDHSANLLKLPCGWIKLQMNAFEQRYIAAVEKAGKPVPDFDRTKRNEIEALLDKVEANVTEHTLREHFDLHDTDEWRQVHAERKIVLCNDDCSPGELIADINSFHTSNGVTHHKLAEKSFDDVSVKHFVEAKRTPYRKLVTQRTVTLS